jgi:hypothetical protein
MEKSGAGYLVYSAGRTFEVDGVVAVMASPEHWRPARPGWK